MAGQPALASEAEMLSGVVIAGGITCPILKLDSGDAVSLAGITPRTAPVGTTLRVSGTFIRYSNCQQAGRTFRVEQVLNTAKGLQ